MAKSKYKIEERGIESPDEYYISLEFKQYINFDFSYI